MIGSTFGVPLSRPVNRAALFWGYLFMSVPFQTTGSKQTNMLSTNEMNTERGHDDAM